MSVDARGRMRMIGPWAVALAALVTTAAGCGGSGVSTGQELIAFMDVATGEKWSIAVVGPDGTGRRMVAETARKNGDPQPSPDGRWIAFVSEQGAITHLFVVPVEGGEPRQLTHGEGVDRWPDWSPDGSQIAFIRRVGAQWDIYVVDVANGESRNVTNTDEGNEGFPDWSPDGSQILFMDDVNGNVDVAIMNADGSDRRHLTTNPADDSRPQWSPDGSQILFVSNRAATSGRDIFVMNADGSDPRNLSASLFEDNAPAWSPDGKRVVFHSWRNDGVGDIYTVDVATAELTRLTSSTDDESNPAWSPDGSQIIYTRTVITDAMITLESPDEGGETPAVTADTPEATPGRPTLSAELWIMDADGANSSKVTEWAKDRWTPVWFQVAGD